MPRERSPGRLRPFALAAAVLFAAGCTRPLALQHEYFAPLGGVATLDGIKAGHMVSHHRALQMAQRACGSAALDSVPDPVPDPGPDPGHAAALRALAETCAGTIAKTGPVAAHGATANAYRRWTEDRVRELPAPAETAADAAGG